MSNPVDLTKLTVPELDALIAEAGARRASLEPAHPNEAPKAVQATVNPAWFTALIELGTLLQIRHPGFGWLSFVIPANERAHLLSLLLNQALFAPLPGSAKIEPPLSASGGSSTIH